MAVLGINKTDSDQPYSWSEIERTSHTTNPNIETEEHIWQMRDDVIEARYAYGSSTLAEMDIYYAFQPVLDEMAKLAARAHAGEDVKEQLYHVVALLQQIAEQHFALTNRIDRVLDRAYHQLEAALDDFYAEDSDTQYPASIQDIL